MARTEKISPEYRCYQYLKHWQATMKVIPAKDLVDSKDSLYPLFCYLYYKTRDVYAQLPLRKNGDPPFLHPINVVLALKMAGVKNTRTFCVALIHDFVEELVDFYNKQLKIQKTKKLMEYERKVFIQLENELICFCKDHKIGKEVVLEIIETTKLLTRHNRDYYFRSISQIYNYPLDHIKEMAIQVKLADRMHDALTMECHHNQRRIYSCFKTLFILNNTKKHILEKYGGHMFNGKKLNPTEVLFKRCAKAVYEAFLTICHRCQSVGMATVKPMIQLAFKKYALEMEAVWKVTDRNRKGFHLVNLFHGVVRKYDRRLHHVWKDFEKRKKEEQDYCQRFFTDFNFNQEQIQAILDYKDAFALKEVVAYLLYLPDYVISQFLCSELTKKGRLPK